MVFLVNKWHNINCEDKNGSNLKRRGTVMNRKLLVTLSLVTPLFFASSVRAGNPQQLQKLISTG
jgi:hypothetical protein